MLTYFLLTNHFTAFRGFRQLLLLTYFPDLAKKFHHFFRIIMVRDIHFGKETEMGGTVPPSGSNAK